jgi:oxygen-independent coproporphyrinogen-3 oxidase
LGLGVSSISDTGTAYAQNEKKLSDYYKGVNEGFLPVTRGCLLSETDVRFRKYITDIACNGSAEFVDEDMLLLESKALPLLKEMEKEGILTLEKNKLSLTVQGSYFRRNVCAAIDLHLLYQQNGAQVYSKAI